MIVPLYSNFLNDIGEYRESEVYWKNSWDNMGTDSLRCFNWSHPWLSTGSPDFLDGNPIFSALSPKLRRGVRIIQHEPTSKKMEVQAWPDFVGGNDYDPTAIRELVISCALSEAAADCAFSLIRLWVEGKSISFDLRETKVAASPRLPDWSFDKPFLPSAA